MNADRALEGLKAIRDALPSMIGDGIQSDLRRADWYGVTDTFLEAFVDWPDGFGDDDWTPAIELRTDNTLSEVVAENDEGDRISVRMDEEVARALAAWYADTYGLDE